ncbi:hypothetical protein P168DRAFT_23174 [Aspergillus campestris IBT 28561]|uniref:Uncharacterized protein n=1 Tax=Aspergillus campestris (strain IBT 28561) TaxID=1392248 RepID=A0A2I1DG00_ASPC2|nr:uncharacterized protein P168DRAFT_23174 [Aspergillus campestris IBT 28561]PKY08799.1 hypothetical protein P168DRAFT_23174 [Aspergillus campestris IBT 28561]
MSRFFVLVYNENDSIVMTDLGSRRPIQPSNGGGSAVRQVACQQGSLGLMPGLLHPTSNSHVTFLSFPFFHEQSFIISLDFISLYLVPLFPSSHIFHHLAFFLFTPLFMSAFAGLRSTIGDRRGLLSPLVPASLNVL